jgi:hypothetical protein
MTKIAENDKKCKKMTKIPKNDRCLQKNSGM